MKKSRIGVIRMLWPQDKINSQIFFRFSRCLQNLTKCRRLVGYFYRSSSFNDCLMEKQMSVFSHEDRYIGHRLIADAPTRWNSSLYMLERILEQIPAIMLLQAIQSSANMLQITFILHLYLLKSNQ